MGKEAARAYAQLLTQQDKNWSPFVDASGATLMLHSLQFRALGVTFARAHHFPELHHRNFQRC